MDMKESKVDLNNLTVSDLGLFASPDKALKLMTIHQAKGHEYGGVAMIGMTEGKLPFYRAKDVDSLEAEKRLFYVGVTRTERLLFYISETDSFRNPPSRYLGSKGVQMI